MLNVSFISVMAQIKPKREVSNNISMAKATGECIRAWVIQKGKEVVANEKC